MRNDYGGVTSYDRLYRLYCSIKQRCYNPNHKGYKYYGAKGIKMCDEWLKNFLSFKNWALENGYDYLKDKKDQTIDRIDSSKNYEPNNCRFISLKENDERVVRSPKKYTYNNETYSIKEWAKIKGWSPSCLYGRLYKGMSFEKAITTPFDKRHKLKGDNNE